MLSSLNWVMLACVITLVVADCPHEMDLKPWSNPVTWGPAGKVGRRV